MCRRVLLLWSRIMPVILGVLTSHPSSSIDKIKAQRAGPPVFFDIILELRRGEPNEWRVVNPCAKAVDMILEGSHYLCQRRTRDPATGELFLALEKA